MSIQLNLTKIQKALNLMPSGQFASISTTTETNAAKRIHNGVKLRKVTRNRMINANVSDYAEYMKRTRPWYEIKPEKNGANLYNKTSANTYKHINTGLDYIAIYWRQDSKVRKPETSFYKDVQGAWEQIDYETYQSMLQASKTDAKRKEYAANRYAKELAEYNAKRSMEGLAPFDAPNMTPIIYNRLKLSSIDRLAVNGEVFTRESI